MNTWNVSHIASAKQRKLIGYISLSITVIVMLNTSVKIVFTSSPQQTIFELNPPPSACNSCDMIGYDFSQSVLAANQQKSIVQTQVRHFSRVEYERLKLGMSLAEVEAILDRGTEINQSTKSATFIWENQDKSRITITFEGGKLTSKMQSGLK